MINEIIEHLEETYALTKEDLALPDDERNFLLGQLAIIDEIKELIEKGLPTEPEEEDKK